MQHVWSLEFPNSIVCSAIGPGNFLITKVQLTIYLSVSCYGSSKYTLSVRVPDYVQIGFTFQLLCTHQRTSGVHFSLCLYQPMKRFYEVT